MARVWAGVNDLQRFLVTMGLLLNPPSTEGECRDYQLALDAAQFDFEDTVGMKPFLSTGTASPYHYDRYTGDTLYFPSPDVFSSITAVADGVTIDSAGAYSAGTVRVLNLDYQLVKKHNQGIIGIKSSWPNYRRVFNQFAITKVTGIKGWSAELPADVHRWHLERAAAKIQEQAQSKATGALNVVKVRQDDVSYELGRGGSGSDISALRKDPVIARYRRLLAG